jgi:hypothetical protein
MSWKLLSAVEYHIPGAVNGMVAPAGNPSLILLTTWFEIELIAVSLIFPSSSSENGFINTFTVKITNNRYSFNFKYSGTEDLRVYLFNKVLEDGVDYSIVNGTKGTDDFAESGANEILFFAIPW